jgi:hypothetical protein
MVAAVPTRGVILGNVAKYIALRIEKSCRSNTGNNNTQHDTATPRCNILRRTPSVRVTSHTFTLAWPLFSFFVFDFGFASVTLSRLKGFLEGFRAPSLFFLLWIFRFDFGF